MQCCADAARLVAGPRPLRALPCAHDDSGDGSGGCAVSGSGDQTAAAAAAAIASFAMSRSGGSWTVREHGAPQNYGSRYSNFGPLHDRYMTVT